MMRQRYLFLLLLTLLPIECLSATNDTIPPRAEPSTSVPLREYPSLTDSLAYALPEYGYRERKHPWRAGIETTAVNALVWGFDHFIRRADFAEISWATIKSNFRSGFLWDNDQFITNLFAHPYHGNLYFGSARSSGLSFYQSLPYALAGSLMWELVAENNPPSINDLLATTLGGAALGEVTNRLSLLPLDDRERGFRRFLRELLTLAVSPMRGVNRILTGQAWRMRPERYLYHDYDRLPVHLSIGLGSRYLADDNSLFRGSTHPSSTSGSAMATLSARSRTSPTTTSPYT